MIEMYSYRISGTYYSDDELKHFDEIIRAQSNITAMQIAIGAYAWEESLDGHSFRLDTIHYDVLIKEK